MKIIVQMLDDKDDELITADFYIGNVNDYLIKQVMERATELLKQQARIINKG